MPGRTDNEIKNVWHTHLKKRLNKNQNNIGGDSKDINGINETTPHEDRESLIVDTTSLQQISNSITTAFDVSNDNKDDIMSYEDISALIDESFWSDVVSVDTSNNNEKRIYSYNNSKLYNDDMEFWFELYTSNRRIEIFSDIPEF